MTKMRKLNSYDARLVQLWEKGWTGTQIALEMGMTRNAVMGKIHRLRKKAKMAYGHKAFSERTEADNAIMEKAFKHVAKKAPPKVEARRAPMRPWVPKPDPELRVKPNAIGLTFWQLRPNNCRYVVKGDSAANYLFCKKVATGRSYCDEHRAICYYPVEKRERGDRKIQFLTKKFS